MNGSRAVPGRDRPPGQAQLPDGVAWSATLENVVLAFDPRVVMAAMHTTMMRASITAYSTAVGPSSRFTNSTNFLVRLRMTVSGGILVSYGPSVTIGTGPPNDRTLDCLECPTAGPGGKPLMPNRTAQRATQISVARRSAAGR